MMAASAWEVAARTFEASSHRRWATPGDLAHDLDPTTVQTPALRLIDSALVDLANTTDGRLIVSMPPQEGKSQRVSRRFPLWMLLRRPSTRVAIASYEHTVARRWGRSIRDDILTHGPRLGLAIREDLSAQQEWQLAGHDGGVYTVGIGGALTGRPVDLLVIDDPIKDRRQADSQTHRDAVWDWWLEVGATRLAPGAPVVLILTRWHDDDLAGRILAAPDGHLWQVLNIPAQADHDPAAGQTDILGRAPGEFMASSRRRSPAQWEAIKTRSGSRTWTALYQGRPAPAEGETFKRGWWRYYNSPLAVTRPDGSNVVAGADAMLISWDMTFKDTASSDYVVGQVWARFGTRVYLLDQVRDRMDFVDTCTQFKALAARWPQATLKLVEDKANGPAVIAALSRTVPGIVPEEPHGSKQARAAAVSPLVEAGSVWLPDPTLAPWSATVVDEAAAFPTGRNDDIVDALTQALNRLVLQPLIQERLITMEDLDDDFDDHFAYIPNV